MKVFLYECQNCFSFVNLDKDTNVVTCSYNDKQYSLPMLLDDNGYKYIECPKEGLIVKVYKHDDVELPFYATPNSSGFDLIAQEDIVLRPNNKKLISTGLYVEIPEGYEIQIRPRSGLSLKTPLMIANSPGTIDSDYRGEIKIIIWNTSPSQSYTIRRGDRIAQGVLAKVERAKFVVVDKLSPTERQDKGFGHSGLNNSEGV